MPSCCLQKPYIFEQLELEEKADVFCLQETLLQKVDGQLEWNLQLPGWHMLWSCSEWPAALGRAVRLLSRRGNSWLSWQLEPWQASPVPLLIAGDSPTEPVRASGACCFTGGCTALRS